MVERVDLPRAPEREGQPPARGSLFVQTLASALYEARTDRAMAREGDRVRGSWSGDCARAISYNVAGVEASNPVDEVATYLFNLGQFLHDELQAAVAARHEAWGAEIEAALPLPHDVPGSCHVDVGLAHAPKAEVVRQYDDITFDDEEGTCRVAVEAKSINGFGYKLAIGDRGPATGPRAGDFLQGCVNALAYDADVLVMCYLALEAVSAAQAQRKRLPLHWRIGAEWAYPRSVFEPIATKELRRLAKIVEWVDKGELVPRQIPDPDIPPGAVIADPATGRWELTREGQIVSTGEHWRCPHYCSYRDRCITDGP